jgi:hypothetical protein
MAGTYYQQEVYQYQDLAHGDSIRLLELQPSEHIDTEIHGKLVSHRLGESLEFEALSYTWGPPVFREKMNVGDKHIYITENLASALKHLRLADKPRNLWIDAICINQRDSEEKGRQVFMMNDLYRKARSVIAWIGNSDNDTLSALNHIRHLASSASKFGVQNEFDVWSSAENPVLKGDVQEIKNIVSVAREEGIHYIYRRPWFSRLWVVQEAILPPRIVLYCGRDELERGELAAATVLLFLANRMTHTHPIDPDSFELLLDLVWTRATYWISIDSSRPTANRTVALAKHMRMVAAHRRRGCQDDRDRVFATVGLCGHSRIQVDVDYSEPVAEVYIDFTKVMLAGGALCILNHAGTWNRKSVPHEGQLEASEGEGCHCPSWVPELRPTELKDVIGWLPWQHDLGTLVNSDCAKLYPASPQEDKRKISISGVLLDKLSPNLSLQMSGPDGHSSDILWKYITACLQMCKDDRLEEHYATGEELITAFARTILAGGLNSRFRVLLNSGRKLTPQDCLSFFHLCNERSSTSFPTLLDLDQDEYDGKRHRFVDDEVSDKIYRYFQCLSRVFRNCSFFITEGRLWGLAPCAVLPGYVVVSFPWLPTPYILCPVAAGEAYQLIGPCYLHGYTTGEIECPTNYKSIPLI